MRGYSLLELIVALAIAALIVVAAAPVVSASVERMTLRSDARTLITELRRLRDRALDRQEDIVVTVSGGAPHTLLASDGTAIGLAAGTQASILPVARGAALVVAWDGTISGGIRLTRGAKSARVLADRLTGRLHAEVAL